MVFYLEQTNFTAAIKQAIKFAGCNQTILANRLGFSPSVFSCKLNGSHNFLLTVPEIKKILLLLVELEAINRREEFNFLLRLAGLRESVFTPSDWQQNPLSLLE